MAPSMMTGREARTKSDSKVAWLGIEIRGMDLAKMKSVIDVHRILERLDGPQDPTKMEPNLARPPSSSHHLGELVHAELVPMDEPAHHRVVHQHRYDRMDRRSRGRPV